MKTFRHVFERVCDADNLERACAAAARGKRLRPEVARYLFQLERNLRWLQQRLLRERYWPQAGRLQLIRDPKPRAIVITPFETRVVHHAVCGVLEPLLSPSYIYDTWACLAGRGAHRAVLRLMGFMQHHRYLVQLDVRKYFLSIPRARLLEALERRVRDERLLRLVGRLIEPQGGLYEQSAVATHLGDPGFRPDSGCGLPIGHLTSQVFGNFYLNPLDHFIKRELKVAGYLRYLDDLVLLGETRAQLRAWVDRVRSFLRDELGLVLNESRVRVHPCTARVSALGYRVSREAISPGARMLERVRRPILAARRDGASPAALARLRRRIESYAGLFALG